ncbi:hypothetical protein HK097_008420 [Rhizophlyctis rosea]|uniref:Uncharacterized protein n=1 Tax=Rhizophlyctis rosea TaxID=64517 RepID=A0AAD5SDH4_9FUNG|nr:hypothetical protein HK097_008420 [Rhizophlyctis rosea]
MSTAVDPAIPLPARPTPRPTPCQSPDRLVYATNPSVPEPGPSGQTNFYQTPPKTPLNTNAVSSVKPSGSFSAKALSFSEDSSPDDGDSSFELESPDSVVLNATNNDPKLIQPIQNRLVEVEEVGGGEAGNGQQTWWDRLERYWEDGGHVFTLLVLFLVVLLSGIALAVIADRTTWTQQNYQAFEEAIGMTSNIQAGSKIADWVLFMLFGHALEYCYSGLITRNGGIILANLLSHIGQLPMWRALTLSRRSLCARIILPLVAFLLSSFFRTYFVIVVPVTVPISVDRQAKAPFLHNTRVNPELLYEDVLRNNTADMNHYPFRIVKDYVLKVQYEGDTPVKYEASNIGGRRHELSCVSSATNAFYPPPSCVPMNGRCLYLNAQTDYTELTVGWSDAGKWNVLTCQQKAASMRYNVDYNGTIHFVDRVDLAPPLPANLVSQSRSIATYFLDVTNVTGPDLALIGMTAIMSTDLGRLQPTNITVVEEQTWYQTRLHPALLFYPIAIGALGLTIFLFPWLLNDTTWTSRTVLSPAAAVAAMANPELQTLMGTMGGGLLDVDGRRVTGSGDGAAKVIKSMESTDVGRG